ncbi:MAG: methyltransferase domain-containing protein [Deltaproteobacteria bacterium]|nr:methyltransferase domain-containing protein [Deltaproteobacteria bacterium]
MNPHKFIKYPICSPPATWIEKAMLLTRFGGLARCNVCGRVGWMSIHGKHFRETCVCRNCLATNRHRVMAHLICNMVSQVAEQRVTSLKQVAKLDGLTIYNTEAQGPVHAQLSTSKKYLCSEYLGPEVASGQFIDGIMHQDLMKLSLKDRSIDLVLSSDVFEHIPDPYQAHEEVYRVLRPHGRHIFTVPFDHLSFLDDRRASLDENGQMVLHKALQTHLDPIRPEGIPVFTIFGLELLVRLAKIGFRTHLCLPFAPISGIWGGTPALVFEAIKAVEYLDGMWRTTNGVDLLFQTYENGESICLLSHNGRDLAAFLGSAVRDHVFEGSGIPSRGADYKIRIDFASATEGSYVLTNVTGGESQCHQISKSAFARVNRSTDGLWQDDSDQTLRFYLQRYGGTAHLILTIDDRQAEAFFDSRSKPAEFSGKDVYGQSVRARFRLVDEDVAEVTRTTPDGKKQAWRVVRTKKAILERLWWNKKLQSETIPEQVQQ